MKLTKLKVGGRTFSLAFTMNSLCEMQEQIKDFDLGSLSEYVKIPSALLDMIVILAKDGEAIEGRTLDVDRRWFGQHISPAPNKVAKLQVAVLDALAIGMKMETDGEEDREVDVVLEEIKKKETKES